MSGTEFWKTIWEHKGLQQNAEMASGRSNYGPSQIRILVEDAVRGLDLKRSDTLLDIGCAAGLMGWPMYSMVSRYVGIDYAASSIDQFRSRCPGIDARVGSATDLSQFKDGEFTKTLLSSVLLVLTLDEAEQALREMRRVTAPGGRGFVSGNLALRAGVERPDGKGCREGCTCYSHCLWFGPGELEALAIKAGWARAEARKISPELPQHAYQFDCEVYA